MNNRQFIVSASDERSKKDVRQRQNYYADWLDSTRRAWYLPDLNAYRDFLLTERHLKPSSVIAHVAAIRTRYRELLDSSTTREILGNLAPEGDAEKQVFVDRAIAAMQHASTREAGHITYRREIQITHLNGDQIDELLSQFTLDTTVGLRDAIIIGAMLCTGITETEVCELKVEYLEQEVDGLPAFFIPQTPGGFERTVPIYDFVVFQTQWLSRYIDTLLEITRITQGHIMQGFLRDGRTLNGKQITPRAIQMMLRRHPIHDTNGNEMTVTALDLRRTCARILFRNGVSVEKIQEYLGHATVATTYEYIGSPEPYGAKEESSPDGYVLMERLNEYRRQHYLY